MINKQNKNTVHYRDCLIYVDSTQAPSIIHIHNNAEKFIAYIIIEKLKQKTNCPKNEISLYLLERSIGLVQRENIMPGQSLQYYWILRINK